MPNYCNFRSTVTAGYFMVILFYSVAKVFEKKLFSLALHHRVYFSRRNKISTITYVCTRQERQTPRVRHVREIPTSRSDNTVGGGGWGRKGEGNFCDRAIILSASLKDRTNRNTGRLWSCYVCKSVPSTCVATLRCYTR